MKIVYDKTSTLNILTKICIVILFALCLYGCSSSKEKSHSGLDNNGENETNNDLNENPKDEDSSHDNSSESLDSEITPDPNLIPAYNIISNNGMSMETRINPPEGYTRIASSDGELAHFIRGLKLKGANDKLLYYDGSAKPNQKDHAAIFDFDIGDRDLQQCADSILRIYAEYYWSAKAYDKIAFHLTNGFFMEYTKWRDGNRLLVNGNDVSWRNTHAYDDSYECFRNYLDMVYAYAGTLSLSQECEPISIEEMRPGDMFLQGGSPGHCVMVVDVAANEDGSESFLLAQGYMPAQDFHILKNPLHPEDPWYYETEITFPFYTPSWTFDNDSLVRWGEFPLTGEEDDVPTISDNISNEQSLTLLAVGDNLIHIEVVESGKQDDGTYNFDHLYDNIKDEISKADIAVINQETILGGDSFKYSGYPNFNSPYEIGEAVINAGFDVVLHATNHTLDKGLKGVLNTIEFWNKYSDITVIGINETKEQQDSITIIEQNGIKLAMLNYTYSLNGHPIPEDAPYIVNMLNKDKMALDIKKAKKLADFVIVFPHWGIEYVYKPVKDQQNLVDFYYKHGVDMVIGTHPHVLEPVEWIEKDDGHRMLVYYSLGNFMSYQKETPRMLGGMADVTITKDETGTYISKSSIIPIVTHYEHGPSDYNYNIYTLTNYNEELACEHGVTNIARDGAMSFDTIYSLADEVLGSWFD